MDPNVTLAEIHELIDDLNNAPNNEEAGGIGGLLADRFDALDQWLTGGGFLPAAWADARRTP